MSPKPSPKVSVIVCTMNRSQILADACRAMLADDYPAKDWELVIVDNGSTDDTLDVARSLVASDPQQVRLFQESEMGLSAARNAGIRHARGDILVFADDDAFPQPGWLSGLVDALEEDHVMAVGGPVDPWFQGSLPDWFDDHYLVYLTAWDLGPEPQELIYNEFPRGANMAFHREAFDRFGWFSTHLGRRGSSLRSCEETEICLRIQRAGFRVRYAPEARVRHRVDARRIDEKWLLDRFSAQGESEAIVDWMHGGVDGLRQGLIKFRRNVRIARKRQGVGSDLYRRLQGAAYRAYRRGMMRFPLTIKRYRPANGSLPSWPG